MNREENAAAKRRLDQVHRELETELLTPRQQFELEARAAHLNRMLHRQAVLSRATTALIGAVFGAAIALLYHGFITALPADSLPQVPAAWASYYAWLCAPWALIGALVGAIIGRGR